MAVTLDLENDELATLFFFLQMDEKICKDPTLEKLTLKIESLVYSRFSIDEIEKFKDKVINEKIMGEFT